MYARAFQHDNLVYQWEALSTNGKGGEDYHSVIQQKLSLRRIRTDSETAAE